MNIQSNELHGIGIHDVTNKLKPLIAQKKTQCIVLQSLWRFKLFHGSNLLTCNEQFVIGKSIVGLVI